MSVFPILFLAINLAIPYWLWTRSSPMPPKSAIRWPAWENQMQRILEASGGVGCPTKDVVMVIRDLCERSSNRLNGSESVAFELPLANVMYSCERKPTSFHVRFAPYLGGDAESPCVASDAHLTLAVEPDFLFTLSGFVNRIGFRPKSDESEAINISSCRKKLKLVSSAGLPPTLDEFIKNLGQSPDDPEDYVLANRLCLIFDSAPGWRRFKRRYLERSE